MIEISKTDLDGVLLITPGVFEDHRGEYIETYNESLYKKNGIDTKFIQDDISVSTRNILRGIHGDDCTWKLISCLYGRFYLVVVNCDTESKDFGRWQSFVLSDRNRLQVLVPPKYGNAHLVLSDMTIFHYKQSTYYDRTRQFTYKWNDQQFDIWWPIENPILSQRDESANSD
ncbi:MAG: dTDP-4-keto-6-deoxy-D-glucose epimerase [Planctomycetes bacterium]|nr:dTDP-4-keto-6-deoxy-D-glucose epimerase [Planctomycetota bacterium]